MSFQFKIQINNITDPPVWRRLIVPASFSFWKLHRLIQIAFGWEDAHLFYFSPQGWQSQPNIGIPYPEAEEEILDSKKIKLSTIFKTPGQPFVYLYDFGDNWEHQITLEKIVEDEILKAEYIDGEGACPPEDCGGTSGYQHLKDVLNDTNHAEHGEFRVWMGIGTRKFDAGLVMHERIKKMVPKV